MDKLAEAAAHWNAAEQRYRAAIEANAAWKSRNPEPRYGEDGSMEEDDATDAAHAEWEKGAVAIDGPVDAAREALIAMPVPCIGGLLTKLAFVREMLEGWNVERDLEPTLTAIERDILRLASQNGEPPPVYPVALD